MRAEGIVKDVQDVIERERDWLIDLAQRLVRIPSVNPKFGGAPELSREPEVQTLLDGLLREAGFATQQWDVVPGRPNLVADLPGSEERSLILLGHVDVVPTGDVAAWSVDPFGGTLKDGRIFGRGAVDMKGGVAACVAAARAVRRLGIELEGRLSLHSVIDEEAGSLGAIDAVKRGQRASAVLVAEPTWGDVMPAEGGCEWVRITFRGRNAHASWRYNEIFPQRPDADRMTPGVNAIEIAARFVEALRRYEHERTRERSHPLLPLGVNTMNVGAIHGGSGLGPGGLPLTTTNPAMTPDVAVVDVNVMFLPNETSAEVRRDFEKFVHRFSQTDSWLRDNAPVVRWELSGLFFPPFDTPVDHPLVRSLVRRKSGLGTPPAVRGFVAVTDGAYYANAGMSPVIFGPAGAALHGVDEFVDIDSMVECAKVTASAIIDWCGLK